MENGMNLDETHLSWLQVTRKMRNSAEFRNSALLWAGLGDMQKQDLDLAMTQSAAWLLEGMEVFVSSQVMTQWCLLVGIPERLYFLTFLIWLLLVLYLKLTKNSFLKTVWIVNWTEISKCLRQTSNLVSDDCKPSRSEDLVGASRLTHLH